MNLPAARTLAARGELYPAVIVHGADAAGRLAVAEELARALLCEGDPDARPCGACRHCRRIAVDDEEVFHPDFRVLRRDLKTATSVEATRQLLRLTQQTPFEARGQVLIVAEAETLSEEAANSLLKVLEEPPTSAPRHFFLLAPAREDLLPTLRSRSWALYLGGARRLDPERVAALAEAFGGAAEVWQTTRSPVYLLAAAAALEEAGDWSDPRDAGPWATAAAAVTAAARENPALAPARRHLLALAHDLLAGQRFRLRYVPALRTLEGLVAYHLTSRLPAVPGDPAE